MFYCTVLLLLAATADVFGYTVKERPQVGIVGGGPVPISEVPYMAHLRTYNGTHYCGATIIHKQFILTAAHCCYNYRDDPSFIKVAVGSEKTSEGVTYDVEKVIIEDRYHFSVTPPIFYDICLLKLREEICFGPNVTKVELADENLELNTGTMLNATGWGWTGPFQDASDILLQVSIPFVNQSECAKIVKHNYVNDAMICAGVEGKSICPGDSGGPLTWNNVQVGITSFGNLLCDKYPGVFTKIAAYLSWIRDTIASNI